MQNKILFLTTLSLLPLFAYSQQVDFSVVSVNEESGMEFTRITSDNDYVCMPLVKRSGKNANWLTNKILDISKDGNGSCLRSQNAENGADDQTDSNADDQGNAIPFLNDLFHVLSSSTFLS